MDISTVVFFLVVCGFHGIQAGPRGPTLADRVAVMEEEMKIWKIATVQAKTERNTLARRMRLAFAEINILKSSLQNTKTQLKEITQELGEVRRERDTYSESLRKLRGEVTEDIHALKLLLNQSVADLSDARMIKSDLNLTSGDLLATKQQITGLTKDLMALNMNCCRMRKEAEETDGSESSPTTSSLAQAAFTTATTMHPGTTAASTGPNLTKTVPPTPVSTQDSDPRASTTAAREDLTPNKTVPPTSVTTQDSVTHATPSPARGRDLVYASKDGDLERVKRILAAGHVDINTRVGLWRRTPVMAAAWKGHSDVVEFLVDRGADVSLVDGDGYNALHFACVGGDLETVKLILSLNVVDVNSRGYYRRTPVMAAAANGHRDVVEFLVGRGADVSLVDKVGDNVLHYACVGGDLETVKLILSLNVVDVNARSNFGETAADWARGRGHQRVLDFLVSRGAH